MSDVKIASSEFPTPAIAQKAEAAVAMYTRIRSVRRSRLRQKCSKPGTFMSDCEDGNFDAVKAWIEKGADVNQREANNLNSALDVALMNGYSDVACLLVDHGAEITKASFYKAASSGCIEIIARSIRDGQEFVKGESAAIGRAACDGHIEIMLLLLAHGSKNKSRDGYLAIAADGGHTEAAALLLEHGADITCNNYAAVGAAVSRGHVDMVSLMIRHMGSSAFGNIPLYNLGFAKAAEKGHIEMAELLFRHRPDIIDSDAFSGAIEAGCSEMVSWFLEHGADIRIEQEMAITLAARSGHDNVVSLLIERAGDKRARFIETVAMQMTIYGRYNAVRRMVRSGVDIRVRDEILKMAAMKSHGNIMRLMVDNGADTSFFNEVHKKSLADYDARAQRWRQVLRRDPLPYVWREDPALFKGTCYESVRRILAVEGYSGEQAAVMAFHAAALFQSEGRVLQYLKQWGGPGQ